MADDNSDMSLDKVKEMAKIMKDMAPQFKAMGKTFSTLSDISKTVADQAKEQLTTSEKIGNSASRIFGKSEDISAVMSKTNGLIKNIVKGGMAAWLAVIEVAIERWIELDSAAGAFRLTTKLIDSEMTNIRKSVEQTNVRFAYMGITLEAAYKSAASLYSELQSSKLVTKDMIEASSLFEANLGISSQHVAKFHARFSEIAKNSGTTSINLIASAAALSDMAGVAPNEVMDDIANASERTLTFLAKNPMQLIRATVEARRLGTTIKSISESARGMLNFQESITSEMEASALLGVNVNFQLSRQLAFEKDIVGSRKEALRQIEMAGEFTAMNVYQQEALSKAANMTVDEIIKQQNQQKILNALRSTDVKAFDEYNNMVKLSQVNERESTAQLAEKGRKMMEQMKMQSEMNKLTNSLKDVWVQIGNALLPIANVIMPAIVFGAKSIAFLSKLIIPLVGPLTVIFGTIFQIGEKTTDVFLFLATTFKQFEGFFFGVARVADFFGRGALRIAEAFGVFFGWIAKIASGFKVIGQGLAIFGKFAGFLAPFFKFIPVIGWVITGIQFIFALFNRFSNIKWGDSLGENILIGIKAIGGALYDVLLKPFVDAWEWLGKFMGHSPSELGLGIVKGIKSVGNMLFEALLWPFNKLMGVLSKLPIIGKLFGGAKDIVNSLNPFMDQSVDVSGTTTKIENMDILVDSIKKLTDVIASSKVYQESPISTQTTERKSSGIEDRLDELISLMKSGAIGVSIDGRRISSRIAVSSGT